MSVLKIYEDSDCHTCHIFDDPIEIAAKLKTINVNFERWPIKDGLTKDSSQEEILDLYRDEVSRVMREHGFHACDVISVNADVGNVEALRKKFLAEHTHSDDEVRYFIEGQGLFCIHTHGKVYSILCTAQDFLSIPSDMKHWFDFGDTPYVKCIRFFIGEEGWVPVYTDNKIAEAFPTLS